MNSMAKIDIKFVNKARKKAKESICRSRISALGFNRQGVCVLAKTNKPRFSRPGGGMHAEKLIMLQAKKKGIIKILICRIGLGGDIRPIHPCKGCQKLADKLGITIESINES